MALRLGVLVLVPVDLMWLMLVVKVVVVVNVDVSGGSLAWRQPARWPKYARRTYTLSRA